MANPFPVSRWHADGRDRPNVVVLGAADKPNVSDALDRLLPELRRGSHVIAVDRKFDYCFECDETIDLVIVLGGDGSILQAARLMGRTQYPVLGINCGRLGFLAALQPDRFLQLWPSICEGRYHTSSHLMFECELFEGDLLIDRRLGLNEMAVLGGPPYRMLRLDLYVDGMRATTYNCDGLIISTPIGSTAHNLSAGGPILQNLLHAFVISPISPHTLTMRPVVDTADRVFELRLLESHESCSVVVDGRIVSHLSHRHRIRISRSQAEFHMLSFPGRDDYASLRDKLGWSGTPKVYLAPTTKPEQ